MRTLTSVQSASYIQADIFVNITPTDQSTTFNFDHVDIIGLTGLSWEIPFGGGLGTPSNYKLTLSSSLEFIKNSIKNLPKAEVRLRIDLNDDTIYPHVGRVQSIERNGSDPNQFTLKVYDRILDANPSFPTRSIVDSYSVSHPEVINSDFGYPRYYGRHHRPFFMTPVDCYLGSMLGPVNVSSANHVSSVFFNSNKTIGYADLTVVHEHLMTTDISSPGWHQDSGADNFFINRDHFEVQEESLNVGNLKEFSGADVKNIFPEISSIGLLQEWGASRFASRAWVYVDPNSLGFVSAGVQPLISRKINASIDGVTKINFTSSFTNIINTNSHHVKVITIDGDNTYENNLGFVGAVDSNYFVGSVDVSSIDNVYNMFDLDSSYFRFLVGGDATDNVNWKGNVQISANIKSEEYTNYSVYARVVNSADIAISENPIAILDNIFDVTSVQFVQNQSSLAQANIDGNYNMQCFFGERQPLTSIIDEFGKTTANYMWIGDSGMINYRTYQESASVTLDATITTSDMLEFSLKENPLGVTQYQARKAKRLKLDYGYDFIRGRYSDTIVADPSNTALCNSAQAKGIDTEIIAQSKYILSTDTASRYLGNLVRRATQAEEFAELVLPARYMGIELADVVKVQHPMLVGSEGLFQVTAVTPDYITGTVFIRTTKLLSLDPQ